MAINFPSNPSNEQQVTLAGTTYTYNSAKTKWEIRNLFTSSVFDSAEVVSIVDSSYVSSRQEAAGVTVYANRSSLPASGNTAGDQAYVTANNRLYIWNGTGWYNIALLNLAPSIQSVLDSDNNQSPFSLAIDGTPTTITITATDSDGDPITYGYNADSNFNGLATLSQANNVFTITPFSQDSATTSSGTITFTATDDVNVASSGVQTFTLTFLSPLWDETVLSIGTSSTNSLDNSTFIDRSTNANTVTSTGSPTQTAFHPYLDNWSARFDGTGDYLTINDTTIANFGTNDFTVEAWVLCNDTTGNQILETRPANTNGAYTTIIVQAGSGASFYTQSADLFPGRVGTINVNQWHHIAWVRNSGTISIYVDGTSVGSASNSTNFISSNVGIGWNAFLGENTGSVYISDLRIVKGTALYTSDFTPPTGKLTAVSGTSLLICQSNRFIDNSTNNHTITVNGDPEISVFNPYGQGSEYTVSQNKGSVYFNSASDYLDFGQQSEYVVGNNDFDIKFWIYPDYPLNESENPVVKMYSGSGVTLEIRIVNTNISFQFGSAGPGDRTILNGSENLVPYQWNYIRVGRDTSNMYIFVNGVLDTSTSSSQNVTDTTYSFYMNANQLGNGGEQQYISDFYFSNSNGCGTATFTPPTAPVGNTNASLYLPMDNAGIFDKTGNNTLTLYGNTSTSTTQTKYADTAIYFDGNDYMLAGPNEFYDNDFTIELWWYPTSTSRQALMHGSWGNDWSIGIDYSSTASNQKIGIWASSNGSSWNLINSDSGGNGIGSETINQNAWNHIAYTRSGTTWRLFVNGVLDVELTSISGSIARPTQQIAIGAWWSDGSMVQINGYIENFQILKGVAKYTANFTPPTQEQGRTYQAED